MPVGNILEPVLVGAAFLLYLVYHVYLWIRYVKYPYGTTFGHNHEARTRWVEMVMRERKDILAVQTIRNSLMSASLLASTSLTLSAVVAAYLVNTISVQGNSGLDLLGSTYINAVHKFFGVIVCFTIAFYCYMQSIRSSNHLGYMISLPLEGGSEFTPEYVGRVIRRGANFHTAGTRIFYLAFLFVIWIFGPIPPVVLTLILIPNLWYLDHIDTKCESRSPNTILEYQP